MGLPVENDLLLAITSAQIRAESKFGTQKKISHVICHVIIYLKILNN